jgi:hypothetical protein
LNNSIKYSSTRLVLIEVLYDFKIKELLDLLRIDNLNLNNLKVVNVLITPTEVFKNIKSPSLKVRYNTTETFRGDVFFTTVYRPKYINI